MKIIKSETITISKKESKALDLVDMILSGIYRESNDPELLRKVETVQFALSDVYEYITDVEEDEE